MRLTVPAGILLVVVGMFVIFPGLTYRSDRHVVDLGDFHASVEERHTVPWWIGAASVASGILLIAAGQDRHRHPPY